MQGVSWSPYTSFTVYKSFQAFLDVFAAYTKPVEKAKVIVYNFQLQPIGEALTDAEGFAIIETKGTPFIVVAESEKQKAYEK